MKPFDNIHILGIIMYYWGSVADSLHIINTEVTLLIIQILINMQQFWLTYNLFSYFLKVSYKNVTAMRIKLHLNISTDASEVWTAEETKQKLITRHSDVYVKRHLWMCKLLLC